MSRKPDTQDGVVQRREFIKASAMAAAAATLNAPDASPSARCGCLDGARSPLSVLRGVVA